MDGKPIAKSSKLLLVTTSRMTNTGFQWKEDHKTVAEWGRGPVLIEPVTGIISLRGLKKAKQVRVRPLFAEGRVMEAALPARQSGDAWQITLGKPATTWCVVEVER